MSPDSASMVPALVIVPPLTLMASGADGVDPVAVMVPALLIGPVT